MLTRSTMLRLRRWLPVLLFVSLAANLFFAGAWLSDQASVRPHEADARHDPLGVLESVASRLPPNDATIVRKAIDGKDRILVAERERRRNVRERLKTVLEKDPFDREALTRLLDENEQAATDYRRRIREGMIEAVEAVSPGTRRQLAVLETDQDKARR